MSNPFNQQHSFRSWLEKAIRCDDNADWTPHTIDYDAFKIMLKAMARRRAALRKLLQESTDGRVSQFVLEQNLAESLSPPDDLKNDLTPISPPTTWPATPKRSNTAEASTLFTDGAGETDQNTVTVFAGCSELPNMTTTDHHYQSFEHIQVESSMSSDAGSSQFSLRGSQTKRKSKRSVMRKVSIRERAEMTAFLRWEMDKVHMFYITQWQKISQELENHIAQMGAIQEQLEPSSSTTTSLGEELLELLAFCVINIVTACQILIRYDAYARTFEGTPMLEYYMKQVVKKHTSFRKILRHEELIALLDVFRRKCQGPLDYDNIDLTNKQASSDTTVSESGLDSELKGSPASAFDAQREMFRAILASLSSAQSVALAGQQNFTDSFIKSLRSMVEVGHYEDRLGLEPAFLMMRGKSLTEEMKQLAEWRKRKRDQHNAVLPVPKKAELKGIQIFNLTLNLISAFLYCMNYYIVEPSSTMYVNRLGAHDAMSGTLIGMMPLAAFASSIPFSMWTNYSFRFPMIMSCTLLMVGNLLYSLADQVHSIEVALLGRFISGLGAPKCIIRRYMADTTPLSLRTSVNASFGMVVAAGSAMGPAMAVLLNKVEFASGLPFLGFITFNGLTMPGYFMACLWATFLGIILMTFEEPEREGLAEQKRLEEQRDHKRAQLLSDTTEPHSVNDEGLHHHHHLDDLRTIYSSDTLQHTPSHSSAQKTLTEEDPDAAMIRPTIQSEQTQPGPNSCLERARIFYHRVANFTDLITLPVRICLGLLFAKVFTIEALVSATSALSKNRYGWQVQQVGTLGFLNGCLVIPFSITIGRLSLYYQDQKLMRSLVAVGCVGLLLLIDVSDLIATPTENYNEGHPLAVGPHRYVCGYFLVYLSIQAFEGVIGSALSKVIPTSLASGTFNSGLLATLVDTLGRACGDLFISFMGFINLRQLMNLLFIPGFTIMATCLVTIERYRDLLAV